MANMVDRCFSPLSANQFLLPNAFEKRQIWST